MEKSNDGDKGFGKMMAEAFSQQYPTAEGPRIYGDQEKIEYKPNGLAGLSTNELVAQALTNSSVEKGKKS